jgi:signal transduction histidine kinase/ActR/RegA family two-component response regulator
VQSREEVVTLRTRLQEAADSQVDGVLLFDADDRFVMWNKAYREDMKENSDLFVVGTPFIDIQRAFGKAGIAKGTAEDNDAWLVKRLEHHRDAYQAPLIQEIEDGRWATIHEYPISDGGIFVVRTDVTDLRLAQTEADEARIAAEIASQAKSDFLSSMSHELRTPMNAILGFGQLLEHSSVSLTSNQRAHVRQILDGGEHLLSLINQVLELTKIEAGTVDLLITEVSVEDVVAEACMLVQTDADQREVTIYRDDSGEKKLTVRTDRTRFKQVLLNLLSNAVKYNRPGGTVAVDWAATSAVRARILVTDTGDGIADDKRSEVFEVFNRLGRESGNVEGTGIGLRMTKQLVELLGGNIDFTSKIGEGTTFWVDIPSAAGAGPGSRELKLVVDQDRRQGTQARNTHTILYVEDDPPSAQLMKEIVRQSFYSSVELKIAGNAELGLALAAEYPPDLVLLDVNIPDMDGFEVLRRLRRSDRMKTIPVIALSADALAHQVKKGIEAGFFAYLTKPLNLIEVQNMIRLAWRMNPLPVAEQEKA